MLAAALTVGVIGHVDHGKTALVRALTGIETDRLAEEKRRGISIALGFAHFRAGTAVIDLIDMPGHERFVRTMIAGATGMRAVLMVVAADEGVRPQTVEHAEIAALLGVRAAVIAVTRCDLASDEQRRASAGAAARLAAKAGLTAAAPPVFASAVTGEGIAALGAALADLTAAVPPPADRGIPYLPIDRAFSIAGHGTVVTGTLRGGAVAPGDELEIRPGGRRVRVRVVQVRGTAVERALPGQRAALNLRGIAPADVPSGAALVAPGALADSGWLTIALRNAPSAPAPLRSGQRLRLLFGTAEADAVVRLLDRAELAPGEDGPAQLRCIPRVALPVGECVILRQPGHTSAVAGGRVLDANAHRLRRSDPEALAWVGVLAEAAPEAILRGALERAGTRGARVIDLARLAGQAPAAAEAALRRSGAAVERGIAITRPALEGVKAAVLERAARHPDGIAQPALAVAGCNAGPVLELALAELARAGRIARAGGKVRFLRPAQEARRHADEASLAEELAAAYRRAGLMPPSPPPSDPATRRALDRLVRQGLLIRTYDRVQKREILFHADALGEARRRLRPLLARGMTVSEVGAALGITRKYSVPLLEYLDAVQFTRRVGDRRMLR